MRIEFVKSFEAKTATQSRTIAAGTVIDVGDDKAEKLIAAGIAKIPDDDVVYDPASLPYLDYHGRLVIPFDCPPKYRHWAGGQSIRDTLREIFEERAGIMQFCGGLSKEEAEKAAAKRTSECIEEFARKGVDGL